jgi:hypothetical protein
MPGPTGPVGPTGSPGTTPGPVGPQGPDGVCPPGYYAEYYPPFDNTG